MTRFPALFANAIWLATCAASWQRFGQAAKNVRLAQERRLFHYLRANAGTEYGQRYQFDSIHSIEDYQQRLPLSSYDDYLADIEATAAGRPNVLTADPIRLFELSSGSTAASKIIPYTSELKAEFQSGVEAWIWNLYTHQPALMGGPAYWSITPLTDGLRRTAANIPIGFDDDSAYLGQIGKLLNNAVMAAPNALKSVSDVASFRYLTLLHLLAQPNLRLISVWNPTYLSLLLEGLDTWWPSLMRDLASGQAKGPDADVSQRQFSAQALLLPPNPGRARQLDKLSPLDYRQIWPRLSLISCWTDGPSALYAQRLAAQFPGVAIQGKGLLATEGFVSFPLWGKPGAVLAVTSHFFEFLPDNDPDRACAAEQLEMGQSYGVVLTTAGGFYRYQLFDRVEVMGHFHQAPLLRFSGKSNRVADFFGEKLEEGFVASVIAGLFPQSLPRFATLVPEDLPTGFCYVLYLEPADQAGDGMGGAWQADLEAALDRALCANFHYAYCRRLGQLAPARLCLAAPGAADRYLRACQARGQRLGNIKPSVLQITVGRPDWIDEETPSGGTSG